MPYRSGDARQDLVEEDEGEPVNVEIYPVAADGRLGHSPAGIPTVAMVGRDGKPGGIGPGVSYPHPPGCMHAHLQRDR
jgi:hypothetical protein